MCRKARIDEIMLFKFEIPITNYERNGIFFKCLYFESLVCPTFEQLHEFLISEDELERQQSVDCPSYGPYTREYLACKQVIELHGKTHFPILLTGNISSTNSFVRTLFGRQPITVYKILPFRIFSQRDILEHKAIVKAERIYGGIWEVTHNDDKTIGVRYTSGGYHPYGNNHIYTISELKDE